MAVQFILGRSGSGKTDYCIKSIVEALLEPSEQQLILLVPEQATYQAERAILADERISGYNRLHVLSFDRLQFLLSGKNTARPILSRIGRQMIVHRLLRDNKDKLKIFGSSANRPGLSRRIVHTIEELHQYAGMPEDIDRLLSLLQKDKRNSRTFLKFADIVLVLKEYLGFIEGNFLDPDVQLIRTCREVTASDFTNEARLWVDGFAGFTTSELAVLTELLKVAADTHIALCMDPSNIDLTNPCVKEPDPLSIFSPVERTYGELVKIISENHLRSIKPLILRDSIRFSQSPPLAHIEQTIFEPRPSKIPVAGKVRIVSAASERDEVRFVTRQILELVRQKSCRYRDIAVIAADLNLYEHYIRAYFEDYNIPFFIDKRKPLNNHPVAQLICSALQVVTAGFSGDDIFACLKTGVVPGRRSEIDVLENYCLAFGITGEDWQNEKQWHFAAPTNDKFDEEFINRIRFGVIRPLLELRDKLCPAGDSARTIGAEEFTRTIFAFLDELNVKQAIGNWIEDAKKSENVAAVEEHQQFYNKLVDVFDELCEVFAGRSMAAEDYLAILKSAFSQLTLAFIPPMLDQVLVGSIERSRHPDLKAVFLIGTTQRQFPTPLSSESILTDSDRDAAESLGFPLAATADRTLTERRYLAYIAFTRPSQYLYVTYPGVDEKGTAVARSQFVDDLVGLFENLHEEPTSAGQVDIEKICNETELADLLCCRLGRDNLKSQSDENDDLDGFLDALCSEPQFGELGAKISSAVNYDNRATLDVDVVDKLFGELITGSTTRLSTFAACPYQYFARYTLGLKEREEFKFEPLDLGDFYHRVLDAWLKSLNEQKKDFTAFSDEELLNLLRDRVRRIISEDAFISHFVAHRGYNEYIINSAAGVLEDCVLAVAQMVRTGSFRPKLSEVTFGRAEREDKNKLTLSNYELALSDSRILSLNGKIDRIDIADTGDKKAAIVFDYKRKGTSFNWTRFYYGLDMQLPIYMLAIRNAELADIKEVIGAFYLPVEVKISQNKRKLDYKANGIFNGEYFRLLDESDSNRFYNFFVTKDGNQYGKKNISGALEPTVFKQVLKFTEGNIVELAEEIVSGGIDVHPYKINQESPCKYCKYLSVCRFDWQINDYNYLESLSKNQVLEKIG